MLRQLAISTLITVNGLDEIYATAQVDLALSGYRGPKLDDGLLNILSEGISEYYWGYMLDEEIEVVEVSHGVSKKYYYLPGVSTSIAEDHIKLLSKINEPQLAKGNEDGR